MVLWSHADMAATFNQLQKAVTAWLSSKTVHSELSVLWVPSYIELRLVQYVTHTASHQND